DQTTFGRRHKLGKSAAAIHAEYLSRGAQVSVAAPTSHAMAAMNERMRNDAFARRKQAHARPGLFDDTAEFVAHNQRRHAAWALLFECFKLTAADATGGDLDQQFAFAGLRPRLIGDFQTLVFGIEQRFHHGSSN